MRRILTVVTAASSIVLFSTVSAPGKDVDKGPKFTDLEKQYLKVYPKARKAFGYDIVGRNIVRDGHTNKKIATQELIGESTVRMENWLNPPAPEPVAVAESSEGTTSYSTPSTSSSGGGCVGMSAESGSEGYNAYNPDGGYIGCYQIAPGHYNGGGVCSGLGTDPAGQDACAGRICESQGPGAWTNPEGQNPCGRL